jgi:hypothetical protein
MGIGFRRMRYNIETALLVINGGQFFIIYSNPFSLSYETSFKYLFATADTVSVIQRYSIRIIVIPEHGENATGLLLQDPDTLFFCYLLLETPHLSEHNF